MAGNTGTIILKADSKGIRKGTEDLKRLDKQAGKSERTAKRLGASFVRMAQYGAVAAVGIAGIFTRSVFKNTIAQQDAVAQLNASLQSTGRFTEEASKALREHAAALQQNSTFADENIIAMQSQLLTFKQLGGEVLPRTTQAVIDLSTKMDQGLKESAVQLGKALNDPVANLGALGRVGIQFSKDQKELIKSLAETGRLAEAQAIILDELESEFGGAAKAARDTLGGALKAVTNNFGDLLEVSGDNSSGVVGSLNTLADTLARPEVKEGFQTLAAGALELLNTLVQLPGAFGYLTDEVKAFFGVIGNDDLVRLDDRLVQLQKDLAEAEGGNFFGFTWEEKAKIIRKEIKETQDLIDAIGVRSRERQSTPTPEVAAAAVASSVQPVLNDPAGPTGPSEAELKKAASDELKRLTERKQATDALRESLRAFAAEQGGPVVEAQQAYENALAAVDEQEKKLLETGGLTKQQEADLQELREAALITREQTIALLDAEAEAKANLITPTEQLIEDLEFENSLIGLSNVEREKAIALRQLEGEATDQQKAKIGELITTQNEMLEQQEQMALLGGVVANSVGGFFDDILDGSKSAKEAFKDMATSIISDIARIIVQQTIMKAFGGSSGDLGGGLFATLFGGGRAMGGPVAAGTAYMVGERGPELIIPSRPATVIPNNQLNNVTPINKNATTNITVNLPPTVQRRTATQMANETAQNLKRASSRNK